MTRFELPQTCACTEQVHRCQFVAVTGGPGAGKTAILEMARRLFCQHVVVLPEAATIVRGGGFPEFPSVSGRKAVQRSIFHVQHEVERAIEDEGRFALALCDRGTVDGEAYWPGTVGSFWDDVGSSPGVQFDRYEMVLHLRVPDAAGYQTDSNPTRGETAVEAQQLDRRIAAAWDGHRNRQFVDARPDFLEKVEEALQWIRSAVPTCCRTPSNGR